MYIVFVLVFNVSSGICLGLCSVRVRFQARKKYPKLLADAVVEMVLVGPAGISVIHCTLGCDTYLML